MGANVTCFIIVIQNPSELTIPTLNKVDGFGRNLNVMLSLFEYHMEIKTGVIL